MAMSQTEAIGPMPSWGDTEEQDGEEPVHTLHTGLCTGEQVTETYARKVHVPDNQTPCTGRVEGKGPAHSRHAHGVSSHPAPGNGDTSRRGADTDLHSLRGKTARATRPRVLRLSEESTLIKMILL